MGGYGSGRWGWHSKKETVNAYWHISAANLPKPGQSSGNSFIKLRREQTYVIVKYRPSSEFVRKTAYEIAGKPYTPLDKPEPPLFHGVIQLALSPRNYGGQQAYFICPQCRKRALKLYWHWKRFACRKCQDLTYESSQRAHENDRGSGYLGALKGVFLAEELQQKAAKLEAKYRRCRPHSKARMRLWLRLMQLWARADRVVPRLIKFD